MARVGWRRTRVRSSRPMARRVAARSPGAAPISKALRSVTAAMSRSASWRRPKSLIVTWRQGGAAVGTVARLHATVLAVADELLYEQADGVARLTINRPERRNAISWGVISGMRAALARAKDDAEVRVVVLTGAGDKAFCAGADLGGMADGDDGFLALHEGRG